MGDDELLAPAPDGAVDDLNVAGEAVLDEARHLVGGCGRQRIATLELADHLFDGMHGWESAGRPMISESGAPPFVA